MNSIQPHASWSISRLTERDLSILHYLLVNRFATSSRLGRLFWKNKSSNAHRRRLRALMKAGHIERLTDPFGIPLYRLSKHGLRLLRENGVETELYPNARHVNRDSLQHDCLLQDLREIFERSPIVRDFVPEHVLRSLMAKKHGYKNQGEQTYKVPDGLFTLLTPTREYKVALELELTAKEADRTRTFLKLLATSPDHNTVFIICKDLNLKSRLEKLLSELRHSDIAVRIYSPKKGFYFAVLGDVLSNGLDAHFEGESNRFTLNEFTQKLLAQASQSQT